MPKDIRYLCKGRKNQLIKSESHSYKDSCLLQSIVALSPVDNSINFEISYRNVTLPKDQYRLNTLIESHKRESKREDSDIESGSSSQESENEADNLILTDVTDCMDKTTNLRTELRTLIIENNISLIQSNKLLLILRKYGHVELPNDV